MRASIGIGVIAIALGASCVRVQDKKPAAQPAAAPITPAPAAPEAAGPKEPILLTPKDVKRGDLPPLLPPPAKGVAEGVGEACFSQCRRDNAMRAVSAQQIDFSCRLRCAKSCIEMCEQKSPTRTTDRDETRKNCWRACGVQ